MNTKEKAVEAIRSVVESTDDGIGFMEFMFGMTEKQKINYIRSLPDESIEDIDLSFMA